MPSVSQWNQLGQESQHDRLHGRARNLRFGTVPAARLAGATKGFPSLLHSSPLMFFQLLKLNYLIYTNNRTCKRPSGRRCRTCAVTRTRTRSVSATCRPGNVRPHAPSVLSLPLCRCGVYAAPTAFVSVDSCSTSIHVQARQRRHDEARKQARLSCCAVVSSWLRCLWRVGALSHASTTYARSLISMSPAGTCLPQVPPTTA